MKTIRYTGSAGTRTVTAANQKVCEALEENKD